jgi:hypothetical protein
VNVRSAAPRSAGWTKHNSIPARAGIGLRFQHHRAVLAFGVTGLVAAQLPESVI